MTTMLKVDPGLLNRLHRLEIGREIAPDAPLLGGTGVTFEGPIALHLVVQRAGDDVVVQGWVRATVVSPCRRCLAAVRLPLEQQLTWLYRAGIDAVQAEAEETYALPERGPLDLAPAVREHVLLAVPQYAVCAEECRGLCPHCGTNRNQAACACRTEEVDPRWAVLRKLKTD